MLKEKQARQELIGAFRKLFQHSWFSAVLSLLVLCLVILIVNRDFYNFDNFIDILRTASFTFIVAAPVTLLLISAEFDLSLGAVISLGGVTCATALLAGLPIPIAILLTLLAGVAVGLLKSFVIIFFKLPPFIITLGIQYMVNGLILVWTGGISPSGLPPAFTIIGQGSVVGRVYNSMVIALLVGVGIHIVLTKTKFGRNICAVGGNSETAHLAGINIAFHKYSVHILVSMFCAFCGMLYASRFSSALTTAGTGTEMNIISACIIGGTSMFGGAGSVAGTAVGCILFAAIANGLVMMRVSVLWQNLIFGLILILSVVVDKYRSSVGGQL
jgi:ribose transport system permease protein